MQFLCSLHTYTKYENIKQVEQNKRKKAAVSPAVGLLGIFSAPERASLLYTGYKIQTGFNYHVQYV